MKTYDNVVVELLLPSDVSQVGELIYSHFGDTYPDTVFYNPEQLIVSIKDGYISSFVIKTSEGNIVAHMALKKHGEENIYCGACSIVHQDYRKQGFALKLRKFVKDYLYTKGSFGFYSDLITLYPFLQKASLSIGGGETGFFLGRVPSNIRYQSLDDGAWLNTILFFHPAFIARHDLSIISTEYDDIIVKILHNLGIANIKLRDTLEIQESNVFSFRIDPAWCIGDLLIENGVTNDKNFWHNQLQKLEQQPARAVYLNLSHHLINDWLEILWQHKYFLVGVIPYFFKTGSALVMQQATDLPYSKNNQFATAFGRQIYEWCMADRERVLSLS